MLLWVVASQRSPIFIKGGNGGVRLYSLLSLCLWSGPNPIKTDTRPKGDPCMTVLLLLLPGAWHFFVILRWFFWTPSNSCIISQSCHGCGKGCQVVSPPPSSSRGFLWASLFLGQRFSAFQDMMSGPSYSKEVRGFYWEGQNKTINLYWNIWGWCKTCLPLCDSMGGLRHVHV